MSDQYRHPFGSSPFGISELPPGYGPAVNAAYFARKFRDWEIRRGLAASPTAASNRKPAAKVRSRLRGKAK